MHDVPKCSDTVQKLCSIYYKIFKVCLIILGVYILKGEKRDTDDMIKVISKYGNKASLVLFDRMIWWRIYN